MRFVCLLKAFVILCMLLHSGYVISDPLNADHLVSSRSPGADVCQTPGCTKAAAEIRSNIDENVDPCDNFYHFACGGWLAKHTIPESESYITAGKILHDDKERKVKVLLEEKLSGTEPDYIRKLKDVYDACMNLEEIERLDGAPLQKDLKFLGGWPVVEGSKWDESNFDWISALRNIRNIGYDHNILLYLNVIPDLERRNFHIIELDQPYSFNEASLELMVKAARKLGADEETADTELLKVRQFIDLLENITLPLEEWANSKFSYETYTLKELQQIIPEIPWLKYFSGLLNAEVEENDMIYVSSLDYIRRLVDLIADTDKRVISNYMLWTVVDAALPTLSKEWRNLVHEDISSIHESDEDENRWKDCVPQIGYWELDAPLIIALTSLYVKHHFPSENKNSATEIVKYIRGKLLKTLEGSNWMDASTKTGATETLKTMKMFIGYPEEALNDTAVSELYRDLKVKNSRYFENTKNLRKWRKDYDFSQLRKPITNTDWMYHSRGPSVDVYHSLYENSIDIPAGYLQNPLFNIDRPKYLNFGTIGYIMANRMIFGLYETAIYNSEWWSERTQGKFTKKAQCLMDQYSNYTTENGVKIDGEGTLQENIADTSGVKIAYQAYQSWVKDNGDEKNLPGLKYNQNQLFWISAASMWCGKYRPEELESIFYNNINPNPPFEFKIIGSFSNMPEFSEDFKCPSNSPMNRQNKCQVF